jgi:hypothetical protein
MSNAEILVLIALINDYQSDGAQWTIDGIKLNELKRKLKESLDA